MKIKLTTDSTCDLTSELLERFDVSGVIPLGVVFGDTLRLDGTFDPKEIYDYAKKNKKLPTSSAVNVYDLQEFFAKHTADGSAVVHFSLSSKMSVSYQNAVTASKEFENVYVVDSMNLSTATSLLLFLARDILKSNPAITAKELAEHMSGMTEKVQGSFCIDTLEYLHKNGRCSALSLLGANLLKLHPSIHVKEGVNTIGRKYRGKMAHVISQYLEDLKKDYQNYDNPRCFITYSPGTDSEIVEEAVKRTKELFEFKDIFVTTAGATITCHCGKGTLGLLFINK